jgi:hypothetical protein
VLRIRIPKMIWAFEVSKEQTVLLPILVTT